MKEKRKKIIGILCLCALLFAARADCVFASQWTDAYSYYEKYGIDAVFHASSTTDGNIYFCARGRLGTTGTNYHTIGWKMIFKNTSSGVLQNLYFKLDGDYIKKVNTKNSGGYEYDLYSVKLSAIKKRLNTKTLTALTSGKCSISLNACMVVVTNGRYSGSMTDAGKMTGNVYTTYEGICGAASWSSASKTALKSYYGKSVTGLFYKVTLKKKTGIQSVSGAGTYCYGIKATIKATPATGYLFSKWTGSNTITQASYSFNVTGAKDWTAAAKAKVTTVTFRRNVDSEDSENLVRTYSYTNKSACLAGAEWGQEGYRMAGWSFLPDAQTQTYELSQTVSPSWINQYYSSTTLYAVWTMNEYEILFDGNGRELSGLTGELGENTSCGIYRKYDEEILLPNLPAVEDFVGWSLSPDGRGEILAPGEPVSVKDCALALNISNTDGAKIVLYAIWNDLPSIEAADLYYSLKCYEDGLLTEAEISSHARAYDQKDGEISYGIGEKNTFIIEDFDKVFEENPTVETAIPITFLAVNSAGRSVEKTINLYLVDTAVSNEKEEYEKLRFISKKYLRGPAGLDEDSIWLTNPDYYALLVKAGLAE